MIGFAIAPIFTMTLWLCLFFSAWGTFALVAEEYAKVTLGVYGDPSTGDEPSFSPLTGVLYSEEFPHLNLTILHLSNGLQVALKPTPYEEGEVMLRLVAKGGYAHLPPTQRASAELAAEAAWESGLGAYTSDDLVAWLYNRGLDFKPSIQPFARVVEGYSDPKGVDDLLSLTHKWFKKASLHSYVFDNTVEQAYEQLRKRPLYLPSSFDQLCLQVLSQGFFALKPLHSSDLVHTDFLEASTLFEAAFANPLEFVTVIVGDFNPEAIVPSVQRYLATLRPTKSIADNPFHREALYAPAPVGWQFFFSPNSKHRSVSRIAFPFTKGLVDGDIQKVQLACHALTVLLKEKTPQTSSLKVFCQHTYDLSTEMPLLALQFSSPTALTATLVVELVESVKEILLTPQAFQPVFTKAFSTFRTYQDNNIFWLQQIGDYLLRGWSPQSLTSLPVTDDERVIEALHHLYTLIELNRYSVVAQFS